MALGSRRHISLLDYAILMSSTSELIMQLSAFARAVSMGQLERMRGLQLERDLCLTLTPAPEPHSRRSRAATEAMKTAFASAYGGSDDEDEDLMCGK